MRKHILLDGPSASGKSVLARALCARGRNHFSTSAFLRSLTNADSPETLFATGVGLDNGRPHWIREEVAGIGGPCVVDAIRSDEQLASFSPSEVVRVNVVADLADIGQRHLTRGTQVPAHEFTPSGCYMFMYPDFTWNSSTTSLAQAVTQLGQLSGEGRVDVLLGGQFGSEGKGKLAALLAERYDLLVRSGGPNAGHWVRDLAYEYCFHHLPSGSLANPGAHIAIAAGATIDPERFLQEVKDVDCHDRLYIDPNVVLIEDGDRQRETSGLVDMVGSTAQGVGSATARRIMRGLSGGVVTAWDDERFRPYCRLSVSDRIDAGVLGGSSALLEGTQGSALSLWHGVYPFVTSRDTNASGLVAECGVPPCAVRDVWMVVRSFPIRVAGNSGHLAGETSWEEVARTSGVDADTLRRKEVTSTTRRQRRVGKFDKSQFHQAVQLNRPTRLFLSFADYLSPEAAGVRDWARLPREVREFVDMLQAESGVPVAGCSTGATQADVAWSGSY